MAATFETARSLSRQAAEAHAVAADVDEPYRLAVARKQWTEAANLLDPRTPEDIDRLVSELNDTDELVQFEFMARLGAKDHAVQGIGLVLARPPHAEHIRIKRLEHDWADARSTENWYELARLTCTFSDADIENRLSLLNLSELQALVEETKGPHAAELARLLLPAERHRARKHVEMCRFALANAQWVYAVVLLNGLSDADQELFVTGLTDPQVAFVAPLVYMMMSDHDRLYSRVNFRQHRADLASAHPAVAGGMTIGAAGPGTNVDGGVATTSANDTDPSGQSGWFGQDYSGPDAANMGWLQFLARDAEKFDDDGESLGFDTSMTTYAANQSEPRHWGTSDDPYWTVDTAGATLPFYDSPNTSGSGFASTSSVTQQAMYDRPDPNPDVSKDAFDAHFWETDVAKVVMRYHFVDYLVHGRAVVHKSELTVVWTFTPATKGTSPPRTNIPGPSRATDKLDAGHYEALTRRFPTWRYFGHD